MDFSAVLTARHSVRQYLPAPVPPAVLTDLYNAVKLAPTAKNRQPCRFVVVINAAKRAALAQAVPQKHVAQAPVIVAAIGDEAAAWHNYMDESNIQIDLGIVTEHLVLAATAAGLGSCWICAFDRNQVEPLFDLKSTEHVYALLTLGYAAQEATEAAHKAREAIFEVQS